MAAPRKPRHDETPTIALFEPLRLIRIACAEWPELDAAALLAHLPPGAASDPDLDRQVPLSGVFAVLAQAIRSVRQPALPIVLATRTRIDEMGLPGFAIMTATSGREALVRAARFQRLICATGAWELHDQGERVVLRWQRQLPLDLGHRVANEIVLTQLVAYARDLLGPFAPLRVCLRHAAPPRVDAHRAFFACPLEFRAQHDEVELPAGLLSRPPHSANPAMAQYFAVVAEERGASLASTDLNLHVKRLMLERLPDGEPSLRALARRLDLPARTLQARLKDEGTSVRALLEELRREHALRLLEQGETITAAAFALGFSETSAFSRAFRRWYGRAPRELLRAGSSRLRAQSSH